MDQIIPYANGCIIYFYMYIAVAVFVLMNLVTAIIVENAMSTSKMDENEKLKQMEDIKKKELKELEHLFYLMDADGMARLTGKRFLTKFENAFLDEEMSRKWRLLDFGPDEFLPWPGKDERRCPVQGFDARWTASRHLAERWADVFPCKFLTIVLAKNWTSSSKHGRPRDEATKLTARLHPN
eukprot:g28300.t1